MSTLPPKRTKTVLVVAAHPDDEVLGCGATMAKHVSAGDAVHVLILAEGMTSRDLSRKAGSWQKVLGHLAQSAEKANRRLGVKSLHLNKFPDNQMDKIALLEIVKVVERHVKRLNPSIIYTHHAGDVNVDHQLTHQAVITACRPIPETFVRTILFFEVPSSTEWRPPSPKHLFAPNWYVDVSKTLPLKLSALKIYGKEMRPWPHPRSLRAIEALARWRGATVGRAAAEAFMLGRSLREGNLC